MIFVAYHDLNFLAFFAALIADLSPDKIFSAPTFFPLVGHPYVSFFLKMKHPESIQAEKAAKNIFFILERKFFAARWQ
jgi:hypothetical protein